MVNGAFLALCLFGLGSQQPRPVRMELVDGANIDGTIDAVSVRIKSDIGEHEVACERLTCLMLDPRGDTVMTAQTSLRGEILLGSLKVRTEKLGEVPVERNRVRRILFPAGPKAGGAAGPPAPGLADIRGQNDLRPAMVVPLQAVVPDIRLSPDRAWVYALDKSAGKLRRFDTVKRTLDAKTLAVGAETHGLAMNPNGKSLYVFSATPGRKAVGGGMIPGGKIQVVTAATFETRSTIDIEFAPYAGVANDQGFIFCAGASGGVGVVDPTKKALVSSLPASGRGSWLRMTPDQKRLYLGAEGIWPLAIPDKFVRVDRPVPGMFLPRGEWDAEISPDGRFLVGRSGMVLRLAASAAADLKEMAVIESHVAAVFDAESGLLLICTARGFLKVYGVPDFDFRGSWSFDTRLSRMAVDARAKALYATTDPEALGEEAVGERKAGDFHVYDLSAVLPGKK